ncbi:hypothetical protein D1872_298650 [compost metagenome]
MPTTEEMLMIRPERCFIIGRVTALIPLNTPFKFVSMTSSNSSSFIRIIKLSLVIPALFTRMSILPQASSTPLTIPSNCSLFPT